MITLGKFEVGALTSAETIADLASSILKASSAERFMLLGLPQVVCMVIGEPQ